MNVRTEFSIKDLENLSGVKAHTIRIWEKRYNLLAPSRTKTNIRTYDINNLKRLLNISYLYKGGHKISKIANLSEADIHQLINSQLSNEPEDYAIKAFKTAMFEFDNVLFTETYKQLLERNNFTEVFRNVFIPLLNEIGMLWQTGTIDPVHESFISELIKQKIILNIAMQQQSFKQRSQQVYALFLPHEEIHEIGLLYANYEIIRAGHKSIYLGVNIPLNNLKNLLKLKSDLVLMTYLTVQPKKKSVKEFIEELGGLISSYDDSSLLVMGPKTRELQNSSPFKKTLIINKLDDFISEIQKLKSS